MEVNDGRKMYFGGIKQENLVFGEVKYVGKFEYQKKRAFTHAACRAISEIMETPVGKVCLTITEFENWGAIGDFRDIYYTV